MVALIAVSAAVYAIDKPYSYKIPSELTVYPGMRVIVPFGIGNRKCEGLVLELKDGDDAGLKPIERVLDEQPVLTDEFIRMAAFVRDRYFCTFYDAAKAMLPAGLWFDADETYLLTQTPDLTVLENKHPNARQIIQHMLDAGGRLHASELKRMFAEDESYSKALQYLLKQPYFQSNLDFSRKINDKTEKIASLALSAEETMEFAQKKKRSAPLQYEVLKLLCAIGSGSTKEICYLTGASMAVIRRLEQYGYVTLHIRPTFRRALTGYSVPAKPYVLTDAQQIVYEKLLEQSGWKKPGVSLLYGVTGSGKTSVYLQLIRRTLEQGKSSIFLVPEIALTPQLIQLLVSQFGDTVAVLHSALRVSERYDEWKRISQGKARVVIGTRSAVFAPVHDLGLLILDEEQEHTYKSENSPRYHAREVAIYRGNKSGALVLLGSATPSVESMYYARNGLYTLHILNERYNGKHLPDVQIVDMKQELREGNQYALSRPLQDAIRQNLQNGRQSILFLNRRGAGRCLICVECGNVPKCPRCSVSLTYHTANHRLMCHYCGFSQPVMDRCPECAGHMKSLGVGTQRVEQDLQQLFPNLQILRMDADTISASNSHEAILRRFEQEKIPILLGTQMVTKGLNFDNVTLVGVLDADMSLYVDHYRAGETTFSLLTQVVGRAGRGEHAGRAMIQTMTPAHNVIRLAAVQDYDSFFDLEIRLRRLHRCPPFGDLFTILFVGPLENSVVESAGRFRAMLEAALCAPTYMGLDIRILGPSPAAVSKINNSYRYRITMGCVNQRPIRQLLTHLLRLFSKEKLNKGVTAFIDINSYE